MWTSRLLSALDKALQHVSNLVPEHWPLTIIVAQTWSLSGSIKQQLNCWRCCQWKWSVCKTQTMKRGLGNKNVLVKAIGYDSPLTGVTYKHTASVGLWPHSLTHTVVPVGAQYTRSSTNPTLCSADILYVGAFMGCLYKEGDRLWSFPVNKSIYQV